MDYLKIPLDDNDLPLITNEMKAEHIGEYWTESDYIGADGEEHILKTTIDWPTIKRIYQAMALTANNYYQNK